MAADGVVEVLGIANLSRQQYVLSRYVSLHDRQEHRIAHVYHPLMSIAPGDVLRSSYKLLPSDGKWDILDGIQPFQVQMEELIEHAASVRLLFLIGGPPQTFHHVLIPRYASTVDGQPVFSHVNLRIRRSGRLGPRGLGERCFKALDYLDPRPPERERV